MKLSLFIHMERISPDEPQDKLYNEMMTLCEMADEAGMHAIWTGEHHGMNFTIAPNPFINLADLANRTKRCVWAPAPLLPRLTIRCGWPARRP